MSLPLPTPAAERARLLRRALTLRREVLACADAQASSHPLRACVSDSSHAGRIPPRHPGLRGAGAAYAHSDTRDRNTHSNGYAYVDLNAEADGKDNPYVDPNRDSNGNGYA